MRATALDYLGTLGSVVVLSAVFWGLERLRAAVRQPLTAGWMNYLYYPFVLAFVYALQSLAGPAFSRIAAITSGGLLTRVVTPRGGLAAGIAFGLAYAFLWDLWQYWIHRWQHGSTLLWQTHRFHHSDAGLNSSSQGRHHPLNYVVYVVCYAPLMVLLGPLSPPVIASVLMFRVWGFVNHANVRVSLGPLTSVIAGPQWHRIHHSTKPEHRDKNFAAFFPVIDRLFGTYCEPGPDEYPATGLADEESEGFMRQATIAPLAAWYRMARASGQPLE